MPIGPLVQIWPKNILESRSGIEKKKSSKTTIINGGILSFW
jgi:hypothetical protein